MVSVLRPGQRIVNIPGIGVQTSRRAVRVAASAAGGCAGAQDVFAVYAAESAATWRQAKSILSRLARIIWSMFGGADAGCGADGVVFASRSGIWTMVSHHNTIGRFFVQYANVSDTIGASWRRMRAAAISVRLAFLKAVL